jgi:hypothetical protein
MVASVTLFVCHRNDFQNIVMSNAGVPIREEAIRSMEVFLRVSIHAIIAPC